MAAKNVNNKVWQIITSSDGKRWSNYPAGDKPSGGSSFSTTFPSTETPVSQGGVITHGTQQSALSSSGPSSTGGSPGICFAPATDALDYVCCVPNIVSTTKQWIEIVINWDAGYTAPNTHEIELQGFLTLGSGTCTGYELDLYFGGTVLQPIRWDDPPGTFNTTAITLVSGAWPGGVVDGDIIRAEFDSTSGSPIITVKLNGVTQVVYTDITAGKYVSGSPGWAFFCRTGTTPNRFCIKGASIGSLA